MAVPLITLSSQSGVARAVGNDEAGEAVWRALRLFGGMTRSLAQEVVKLDANNGPPTEFPVLADEPLRTALWNATYSLCEGAPRKPLVTRVEVSIHAIRDQVGGDVVAYTVTRTGLRETEWMRDDRMVVALGLDGTELLRAESASGGPFERL